jgi:hypothetical protein
MGSSQSSSVKQTVEVLNKSMTSLVTKNTNSATARNVNANNLTVEFGEKARPMPGVDPNKCGLTVGQKINASQTVRVMAKFSSAADLKSQMKNALQNSVDQSSQSTQAALATSIGVQNSKQEINQKISNIVETNITNETVNEVNGFLDNINNGTFEFKGIFPCPIVINQEILSNQVVELLSDAMIGNTISTSTDTEAKAESKQTSVSEQKGVIDAFTSLIGTAGMIYVAVILIVVVGLIFAGPMILKAVGGGGIGGKKLGGFGAMLFGRKKFRFGRR